MKPKKQKQESIAISNKMARNLLAPDEKCNGTKLHKKSHAAREHFLLQKHETNRSKSDLNLYNNY